MNAWKTFFLQTFESIRSELKCQQLRWRGHQPLDPSTTAASFVAEEEKELSSVTLISMHQPTWRKYLQFVGPGYLIAVGYMDPGNWATDIGGGARFGYQLLFVIAVSSVMAMFLQSLCIRLGLVTGRDLAQSCRHAFPPWLNLLLYAAAEIGIMATDLAEVIGCAIALQLLIGLPLVWGVLVTALDVLLVLKGWQPMNSRWYEVGVALLVGTVLICFAVQLTHTKPDGMAMLRGLVPQVEVFRKNSEALLVAIGILGATVMPHNLYLHSSICQGRRIVANDDEEQEQERCPPDREGNEDNISLATFSPNASILSSSSPSSPSLKAPDFVLLDVPVNNNNNNNASSPSYWAPAALRESIHFASVDSILALLLAMILNGMILVVGASAFYNVQDVQELQDAYYSLEKYVGHGTSTLFAFALLASGQSSTLTCTMAGQLVMEGFLGLTWRPALRRLATRLVAILPALLVILVVGERGLNHLLILSQVVLSGALPFAIWPLIYLTSSHRWMQTPSFAVLPEASFASGWAVTVVGVVTATVVTVLNIVLVIQSLM